MKKLWVCIIAVFMLAVLCACGAQSGTESLAPTTPAPASTEAPIQIAAMTRETAQPEAAVTAKDAKDDVEIDPEPEAETDTLSAAQDLIGEDVTLLYAAIGEPNSSDYAPSCLVDGDDGELYYDEFVVYTQRTASGETVYYVE